MGIVPRTVVTGGGEHGLGIQVGPSSLGPENVPALWKLLPSCLGLVIAEVFLTTAQLARFTPPEHLSSNCTAFCNPHSTTARVCLIYLNIGYVQGLSLDPLKILPLEYSSFYWGAATKRG